MCETNAQSNHKVTTMCSFNTLYILMDTTVLFYNHTDQWDETIYYEVITTTFFREMMMTIAGDKNNDVTDDYIIFVDDDA